MKNARKRLFLLTATWLGLSLACGIAQAQEPLQMQKMKLLGAYYSPSTGELHLALLAISGEVDPMDPAKREFHAKLACSSEREFTVPYNSLRVVVLSDMVLASHRKYKFFRFNIVIDESGSISQSHLDLVRRYISLFLREIPVTYEAQIIRFSDQVVVPPGFTNDPNVLQGQLNQPKLDAGTAFFDAANRAILELEQAGDDIPLRFVVAFTDGLDTSSSFAGGAAGFKARMGQVTREKTIPLFLAGIGDNVDSALLQSIADNSLGFYLKLSEVPELEELFEKVKELLKSTYIITIPVSSSMRDLKTVFLMHETSPGNFRTVQDIPIKPGLIR